MPQRGPFPAKRSSSVLRFGDCELQVLTHELWRQGEKQPMSARVFALMLLLIEQRPRAVSHAEISQAVWGQASVRPSLLAKAVMQARHLTGDTGAEPAWFVSVRGVGYRFAGTVIEGVHARPDEDDAPPAELAYLHATLADADATLNAGDIERAQFLADQAVGLADACGVNRERSRALSLASRVAMVQGTLDQAARLATQALRVAESEGHVPAAAEARVRLARVRICVGDFQGALVLLEAAYSALDAPQMRQEKMFCEGLFSWAYRELGQFELALSWCARSQATAREGGSGPAGVRERTFEVDLYLTQADALLELDRGTESRQCFERALALNEDLRPDVERGGDPVFKLSWLGNQSHALGGLDRLEEAWPLADILKQALHAAAGPAGPDEQRMRAMSHCLRADLYCRSRRFGEAMEEAQRAVGVTDAAGLRSDLPRFLSMTASVFEKAGQFQEALRWMRRAHAAAAALQRERASSLALVLHAEAQTDTLRRELEATREQAQQLALQNHSLVQRLEQLERARQLEHLGDCDPARLRSMLEPRLSEARLRDVPFCVALLVLEDQPAWRQALDPGAWNGWMRELAQALSHWLPPHTEIVHWRPGQFVCALHDMGLRRAREECRQIQIRLDDTAWSHGPATALPRARRWRVACADAASDAALDDTLERLLAATAAAAPQAQA